jgi:bifunctional enzyme CysN/CysC
VKTAHPLAFEAYRRNRAAGSFIVIDESNNNTVAAGLIE